MHIEYYIFEKEVLKSRALQFWQRMQEKDGQAFEDYKRICSLGGTLTFKHIVEAAHLKNPFEDDCLKDTMDAVLAWFEKVDDSQY